MAGEVETRDSETQVVRRGPAARVRRTLRKNVYWLMVIGVLLAVVVYQGSHHGLPQTDAKPLLPPMAAELKVVTVEPGAHTFREWAALWSKQTGVEIELLQLGDETQLITARETAEANMPFEILTGKSTLKDALAGLQRSVGSLLGEVVAEYEGNRVVVGQEPVMHAATRNVTVAYPIGDFLNGDHPFGLPATREGRFEQLKDLLRDGASMRDWVERIENQDVNKDYWCRPAGDKMIIVAPPGIQWRVEQFLKMLRAQ